MSSKRNRSSSEVEEVPVEQVGTAILSDETPAPEVVAEPPEPLASIPADAQVRSLAPRGWKPGTKFISRYRDYRLVVIEESADFINGYRKRNPGFTAEFHAGEWTPKDEAQYNLVAEKWRGMYGHLPIGGPNNYCFIEAPDIADLVPKDYDMMRNRQGVEVVVGSRTVRASSRGTPDRS